mgnify:FL=1
MFCRCVYRRTALRGMHCQTNFYEDMTMSVINTNVSAVIAQNALTVNERQMTTAMERLSTGQRINSAADDAAGLAIGARMSAQISGLSQAARNANDGVSMIQTAESAYVEVGDMLQRMRQLAVQSASETYAASDRTALNLEWQALQEEIDRISSQTTWNGFQLLDGTPGAAGKVKIQSGSNASQTVTVDFGALGGKAVDDDGANAIADATDKLVTTVANGSFTAVITDATTAVKKKYVVTMANTASLQTGDVLTFTLQGSDKSTKHEVALTLSKDNVDHIKDTTATDWSAVSNLSVDTSGTMANMIGNAADGTALGITFKSGATANTIESEATAVDAVENDNNDFEIMNFRVRRGHTKDLAGIGVSTQTKANAAITSLDTAIQAVNEQRASYGSYISRLEHAADNLTSIATNTKQSRSRVVDANYATETTELARTQIIQQAATAMLAQANQMKQTVLALLQ